MFKKCTDQAFQIISLIHKRKVWCCLFHLFPPSAVRSRLCRQCEEDGQGFFSLDDGATKFTDLIQLVEFYQLNRGVLPCKLKHPCTVVALWHLRITWPRPPTLDLTLPKMKRISPLIVSFCFYLCKKLVNWLTLLLLHLFLYCCKLAGDCWFFLFFGGGGDFVSSAWRFEESDAQLHSRGSQF